MQKSVKQNLKIFSKRSLRGLIYWLERFSGNILVKSITQAMMNVIPFIIVGAIFLLIISIPQTVLGIIWPNTLDFNSHVGDSIYWKNFSYFTNTVWSWTGSALGLLVTAQLGYQMAINLNARLPFDRQMPPIFVYVTMFVSYILLALIPATATTTLNVPSVTVLWGSQGLLPGILAGISFPWIFYLCYKYGITIKMPPQAPQIVSRAFQPIIPIFFILLISSGISILFIATLGAPFFVWIFTEVSGRLITSINDTWGAVIIYTFLKPLSWFVGVQPNWTGAIFGVLTYGNLSGNASILAQFPNLLDAPNLYSWSLAKTHVFVESALDAVTDAGGAGATFFVPFLFILTAKSEKLKVVGKNSSATIWFQVNEPVLFGAPLILNPVYFLPFILTPVISTVPIMLFWQNGLYNPSASSVPWSTPWFLRTIIPNFNQPAVYGIVVIAFVLQIVFYYPFVKIHDQVLYKEELSKLGLNQVNYFSLTGWQIIKGKWFNYDANAFKIYKRFKKDNKARLNKLPIALKKQALLEQKRQLVLNFRKNLQLIFEKYNESKIDKLKINLANQISKIDEYFKNKQKALASKKEKYNLKITNVKIMYEEIYHKIPENKAIKLDNFKAKINDLPKPVYHQNQINNEALYKYWITKKKIDQKTILQIDKIKDFIPIRFYLFGRIYNLIKTTSYRKQNKMLLNNLKKELKDYQTSLLAAAKQRIDMLAAGKNPYTEYLNEIDNQPKDSIDNFEPEELNKEVFKDLNSNSPLKVLCLCIGAGSSSMLANNINNASSKYHLNVNASALAFGNHDDALLKSQLVIISPQLRPNFSGLKLVCEQKNIDIVQTTGQEYIDLSNNLESVKEFFMKYQKNKKVN